MAFVNKSEGYGPAPCEEGKNVLFPGKTVPSKICVPETSTFEAPSPYTHEHSEQGANLLLDAWEAEQEESPTAPSAHSERNCRLEQKHSSHELSDELKNTKRTTDRSKRVLMLA